MPALVPPLPFFCINALSRFPDQLHHFHRHRIPASPALLDALQHTRDPCLWAALAQLVHPLSPHLHELDIPLSHPALPLLQKIPDSPDFSLVTLLSLPNCTHLRDNDIANIRTLHRLLALDLHGCSISSYALSTLARNLAVSSNDESIKIGSSGLRLLILHGCPNIDNDVLSALQMFPLLSAVDLRYTRCTPTAVNAHLSSLGFRPSDNKSLFHPAPLSLALCTLEKVALTASDPVSLYSCPLESVFRVHIDELNHLPSYLKISAPAGYSNTHQPSIQTISSAEGTVVFVPPPRKPIKNEPFHSSMSPVSATAVPVVPTSFLVDRPTHSDLVSNISSFYEDVPARERHSKKNIFPLSVQAVQPFRDSKLDPLAIARSPPPWKAMDTYKIPVPPNTQGAPSDNVENSRQKWPTARWTSRALSHPLKVDRARLHRRSSDAVTEMVHQFTNKRPKTETETEFTPEKMHANVFVQPRNPFVRSANTVSVKSSTSDPDKPRHVHESSKQVEPDAQLRVCHSLPSQTVRTSETDIDRAVKPLKPITTLKPPILSKELLPFSPRYASKPKVYLKQTRLAFSREGYRGSMERRRS